MVALTRFVALLATLMLLGVQQDANAYPAVSGFKYTSCAHNGTSQYTYTGDWAASKAAACQATPSSGSGSPAVYSSNSCGLNANMYSVAFTGLSANGTRCAGQRTQSNGTFPVEYGSFITADACPNGGTLSGNQCQCPVGWTDTGTGCVEPNPCPAGQFKELSDGQCVPKCPVGQGNGMMEYAPPASKTQGVCGQRQKLGGIGVTDYQGNEILCQYAGVGVTVCADEGNGTMCNSSDMYNLGVECSSETDVPPDETPCNAGDLYCDKGAGACPSGYTPGNFNNRTLCVKNGEQVNVVKRSESALDPKKDPPLPGPPSPVPDDTDNSTSDIPEIFDSVVSVGSGAGTTGGKGSGGEDIITCGLPDTPKCKIDETGTPTKGDFATANQALTDAAKAREDGLATVTSSQGKQTSWAWNLALPTGCQPLSLNMLIRTVVFDPCSYQSVFHDLMSMLWAGATLFAVFGLVGRTLRES